MAQPTQTFYHAILKGEKTFISLCGLRRSFHGQNKTVDQL